MRTPRRSANYITKFTAALTLLADSPLTSAAGPAATVSLEFVNCVARTTIALDDAVTSADVVAAGVLAKCRVELAASQIGSSEFNARLMPVLVASVIVHRGQVRQRRAPQQPLAPLPNAPANRQVFKPTT